MQQEPTWLATLRAEVARTSARRTASRLDYSDRTIRLVLQGKYRSNPAGIAKDVMQKLAPPRTPRAVRAPQMKDLAPLLHAQLKPLVRGWGTEIVARWYDVTPDELDKLMRGHAKHGVQEFIAAVQRLGVPTAPTCTKCGGAL